jgi:diguanylate cyclase (GGDEF)-like protein/PAS domain S-box-containing protein
MRNRAEANLSALIESTEDLIWSVDLNYAFLTFNRAVQQGIERRLGRQAAVGMRPADLLPPEEVVLWNALYERALTQGSYRTELPYPGSRVYELTLYPIVIEGKKIGISVFGKDITDWKKAEKALREAQSEYRDIFDGALEGIFQTSKDARVLIANPALAKILGYDSPEDLISNAKNVVEDVWADREEHARFRSQLAESGFVRGFEARYKRKNGVVIWCALSCRTVYGTGGEFLYIEGFLEDITDRKVAANALLEAEKKYRSIFDGALEGMFQATGEGKPLAVNLAMATMLGYDSPDDLLCSGWNLTRDLWAVPDERAGFLRLLEESGSVLEFDCEFKRKQGSTLWVSLSCKNIVGPDGRTLYLEGFIKDITQRKLAMEALAESESRFRRFFEENGSVMLLVEPSAGEIVAANRKAAEFYGYPKDRLVGMFTYQLSLSSPQQTALDRTRALRRECAYFKYSHRLANGEVRDIEMYSSPFDVDGRQILCAIIHDVTERNRAALALAESEARFRRFFEENGSVMLIVDPLRKKICDANRAAAEFYGYTREELSGRPLDCINTMPAEQLALSLQHVSSQEHTHLYRRHRVASGEVREVEIYTAPIEVNGKKQMLSVVHDVTERKHMEEALRESLESLEEAQKIGGLGSYSLDIDSGAWTSSHVLDELFGIGKEYDHTLAGWVALIHPDHRQMMAAYFRDEVVGKGTAFDKQYRVVRQSDRAERWLHGLGKLEFDGQGRPVRMHGVIKDITEQKHAEVQLRESEERFRATFEQAAVGMCHTSLDGHFLRCNERFAEIVGYSLDEVPGMSFQQITHPEDMDGSLGVLDELLVGASDIASWEKRYLRKDGSLTWVKLTTSLQRDEQGRGIHFIAVVEDINDRKAAEQRLTATTQALRSSEAHYRTVFETSTDGIAISQMIDGRYIHVNRAFLALVEYEREEIVGRTSLELNLWSDPEVRPEMMAALRQHAGFRDWETRYVKKSGETFWVAISASLIQIEGVSCILSVVRDISAAKAAEERLAAAQRALQTSEERYRTAFQTNLYAAAISRLDDGTILEINKAFTQINGHERAEAVGRTVYDLGVWVDPEQRRQFVETLRQDSSCRDLEVKLKRKSGETFWGLISASLLEIDGVSCVQSAVRDISATKAAEEKLVAAQQALLASEARYRTAFQTSQDAISINRLDDGLYIDVNAAFFNMMGYKREEAIGRTTLELNVWVNASEREAMSEALRREGKIQNLEVQQRRKDGTIIWVRSSASLMELDGVPCLMCVLHDITASKAAAEALRRSEERYRTAFQTSHDGISISRLDDGLYLDVNQAFLRTFGYKREEVIGRTSLGLGIWANADDRRMMVEVLRKNFICENLEVRFQRKNRQVFWVLVSASLIELDGVPYVLFVIRDISAAKAASERLAATMDALRASEARYRTAFETSQDSININRLSDGTYLEVNKAFLDVIGYERQEVVGRTSLELNIWADPRDRMNVVEMLRQDSHCRDYEAQFRKKSGEVFWGLMSASLIELDGIPCMLTMTRDISNAKIAEDKIRNLAFYDPLTGLPNRRLLVERLQQALAASPRSSHKKVLLFVDLDNFKNLNDTLGHQAGDLLLQEVARRLTSCVRDSDTVARLGGDEFVVLLEGLGETSRDAASQAKAVAEKILAAIRQPYQLDGRECFSTSSIGITVFGGHRESLSEVMQQADIAMYQAKAAGRNALRFFAPALQAAVNARAAMEDDLRLALKAGQFLLHYQPQVESTRLIGAEALVRWQHPARGLLLPGEFIALAEDTGLILPLGNWVLETACRQIAAWGERKESAHIKVAVNISARQFRQPDFIEQVLAILESTGANPQNLQLELTESMLVENVEEVIAIMANLKSHGVRFSLDDFGTGYSSLSYLKHLPLDQLKIDRSFVRDMLTDASSGAIAQTLISLGRAMGLSVIAEGVETEAQRSFLAGLGCQTYQGYLFSKPLPLAEFQAKWLETAESTYSIP